MPDSVPSITQVPPMGRPAWFQRLHWRLLGLYALLAVPVLGALLVITNHQVEEHLLEWTRARLEQEASLVASSLALVDDPGADWNEVATSLVQGREPSQGAMLGFFDAQGRRLGTSNPASVAVDPVPEVNQALSRGQGASARRDERGVEMLYVARRVAPGPAGGPVAVVRVACRRDAHRSLLGPVRAVLGLSALGVLLLVLLAGVLASRVVSRPMASLGAAARNIASQRHPTPLSVERRDELGLLAESINHLIAELHGRLKRAQEDKLLLSTILDGMTEGVLVCDTDGRLVLINTAARSQLGLGSGVVTGRLLLEVYRAPELKDALDEAMERHKAISRELTLRRGEALHFMLAAAPMEREGQVEGAVAVLHDITQLRKLERVRRDFVSNVSHELRTPLATITGYAETLTAGVVPLDPMAREFVETIERHVKRLNALVSDLLMIARLEADGERPALGPVRLGDAIEEVIDALALLAERREVELTTRISQAPPMLAEPRALTQVLRNLVENAIHYSNSGGVVHVGYELAQGRVVIVVRDEGIGIEPRHLPRIFERFYRVDEGRSRDVGGTGLGLAIVKHMVQAMDGEITVESTPGKGSTFRVALRAAPQPATGAAPQEARL